MPKSWLLRKRPPHPRLPPSVSAADRRLWWAICRQAARDLVGGHASVAWDAAEFLANTGVWLCEWLWEVPQAKTSAEIVALAKRNPRIKLHDVAPTQEV